MLTEAGVQPQIASNSAATSPLVTQEKSAPKARTPNSETQAVPEARSQSGAAADYAPQGLPSNAPALQNASSPAQSCSRADEPSLADAPSQPSILNSTASTLTVPAPTAPASPLSAAGSQPALPQPNAQAPSEDVATAPISTLDSSSARTALAKNSTPARIDPKAKRQQQSGGLALSVAAPAPSLASAPSAQSSLKLFPPAGMVQCEAGQGMAAPKPVEEIHGASIAASDAYFAGPVMELHSQNKPQTTGNPSASSADGKGITKDPQTGITDTVAPNATAGSTPNRSTPIEIAAQTAPLTAVASLPMSTDSILQPLREASQAGGANAVTALKSPKQGGDPGDGKGKAGAPDASAAPARDLSSGNGQAAQRPTIPQAAAAATQQADSRMLQGAQGIAMQSAAHATAPVPEHTAAFPQASRAGSPPPAAPTPELPAQSTVNTANLLQKMGEAEMRVAMHSTDYGAISIRTSLSQQQMLAQITVDHGELSRALTAHIPAVEGRLGNELGMRTVVQVSSGGMPFSGGGGNAQHGGGQKSYASSPTQNENVSVPATIEDRALHFAMRAPGDGRLDIQA